MKIAQIAPIWERIPPTVYGGIETMTSYLTEELVRQGHDVTLFASGDSITSAKLESIVPRGLYREGINWNDHTYTFLHLEKALEKSGEFDIIHNHMKDRGLYFSRFIKTPMVTTLHGNLPEVIKKEHKNDNFVAISKFQYEEYGLPKGPVVYNGINLDDFIFSEKSEDYLLFLGSMFPNKGTYEAIQVALKSNKKLLIAGKVDQLDPRSYEYFNNEVKSLIDNKQIIYLGEIEHEKVSELMGKAKIFLMPITQSEAFGMVMIEAMACGTPVIGFNLGSVSEIIEDTKTGFVIPSGNLDLMVEKINEIFSMSENKYQEMRIYSRKYVEKKYNVESMAKKYVEVYTQVIKEYDAKRINT